QLGIVHRDVKPANLMLDFQGNLWVTDFGLALFPAESGLTLTGDVVGTLRYMSPEQALAKRCVVDHRTDVYALGATLYELLTLRPATDGTDRHEILHKIAFEDPRLPRAWDRAIPADLETIILKAMGKHPDDRYATAQEMADDLRRFLEDRPIQAKRPTLRQGLIKWARRHPAVVAAALLILVLTAIGASVSAALIWREKEQTGQERDRAERNLQLAEENFRLALDAVERYFTKVSENPRLRSRG